MAGPRVRAPELTGRAWLNTGGRTLTLADLRGRIVVLDFWTFCCINCLHVLEELRPIEEKYADRVVIIGVHSPKFAHERDPAALADAVARHEVTHPVLDDPDLRTWDRYTARAWPTLVVIDPTGYVVATMAGEGHAEGLVRLIDQLVSSHEAAGTLRSGGNPFVPTEPTGSELRFPAKALALPDGGLLVADTGHHRLVELADRATVRRRIGSGHRGRHDGDADTAQFAEPQGICRLPEHVAEIAGYDLVVADTANHQLRGVRSSDGRVRTVAGSGRQWRSTVDDHAHDAYAIDLSSPWDVAWHADRVIVAMAGVHQLWWFDPVRRTAGMWAGTTTEGLRDGPITEAFLAQPSGLSASPDDSRLWFVDSETSALRWITQERAHTAIGQGLFDFGHADGPAADALLQHPLGLTVLPDDTVLIADTYNGAVRRFDPATGEVTTVARDLAEPSDIVSVGGEIVVVESAGHRLSPISLADPPVAAPEHRLRTERPATALSAGSVRLEVVFTPAPGQQLDPTFGPATRLTVAASPPELLRAGAGEGTELTRELLLDPAVPAGVLQITAQAATCDAAAVNAACHLTRQDWGVPVTVGDGGADRLPLVLRGVDPSMTED